MPNRISVNIISGIERLPDSCLFTIAQISGCLSSHAYSWSIPFHSV